MPKKKVDSRVRDLITNGIQTRHRSLFVIVGDRGRDQIPNLHYIMSKAQVKERPSVLWCYKKDLQFSSHRKKRMKQVKKLMNRGLYNPDDENPFDLFLTATKIEWCYYKDTARVLGRTFGMCVLQDFESITPNMLCRTIETVEGGGVVVLLLKTMDSLRQLYSMSMDVHSRFRTEAHGDVVARFNERFILSLADCKSALVLDDELNVLPLSRHSRSIKPLPPPEEGEEEHRAMVKGGASVSPELRELCASLEGTPIVSQVVQRTRTVDQARALLTFADAISEKTLRSTVAVTAGRGRGKSAALGLALAAAIGFGYANIFVTAPSPENLGTVFDFLMVGLEALAYKEHTDYEVVAAQEGALRNVVVRVNVFREHRQTIQYVRPEDSAKLAQAEMLVIDEAAAIPLPIVKKLLGPYLVLLSSTVNGYEGTGRSLSLKLFDQLRRQAVSGGAAAGAAAAGAGSGGARSFREAELREPIRYGGGDGVEEWLNSLLCLQAGTPYRLNSRFPSPEECQLFFVDRDALFSYHKLSEGLLYRIMSLFVASHYKNTPNDLQLLSDAPAHRIFVLLGPVDDDERAAGKLPEVLCAVQVCLEGEVSQKSVQAAMSRGNMPSGDLIPWIMAQQFQDNGFPTLSGARVVRIATHPDATRAGYGTRAMKLLCDYFEGKMAPVRPVGERADAAAHGAAGGAAAAGSGKSSLQEEELAPRAELPPLLVDLSDRPPELLHWIGVSFGLTPQLFRFWQRHAGFRPAYLRQIANDVTGEHSCVMIRSIDLDESVPDAPQKGWLEPFHNDFGRRFARLLAGKFKHLPVTLGLTVMDSAIPGSNAHKPLPAASLPVLLGPHDCRRLQAYTRNVVDYYIVTDLIPVVSELFFTNQLSPQLRLKAVSKAALLGMGLQQKDVDELAEDFNIHPRQVLGHFQTAIKQISRHLQALQQEQAAEEVAGERKGKSATKRSRSSPEVPSTTPAKPAADPALAQYAIRGSDDAWDRALSGAAAGAPKMVSVPAPEGAKATGKKRSERPQGDDEATPARKGKREKGDKKSSHKKHKKHKKHRKEG